jgi:hypothetical protein
MLERISVSTLAFLSVIFMTDRCWALDQILLNTVLDPIARSCEGAKANTDECFRLCEHAQKTGVITKLPLEFEEFKLTCQYAIRSGESKQLSERACNESSCIVRLKPVVRSKTSFDYSGNGFTVSVVNTPSTRSGERLIVATINSLDQGKTIIVKNCAPDNTCGGWKRQSGPLRSAQVTIFDKYAILRFSK